MTVTARDRRTLVAGALACVALLVSSKSGRVGRYYVDLGAEASALQARLRVEREIVGRRPAIAARQANAARVWSTATSALFVGSRPNAAAANAAAHVLEIARGEHVELGAIQVRVDSTRWGLAIVTLSAAGRTDVLGLAAFLRELEYGRKLFRVTSLSVAQPDALAKAEQSEALAVQMSLQTLAVVRGANDPTR